MARCEGAIKPLVPGEIFAAKLAAINRVVPSILSLFPSFLRNIVITFCAFTFIKIKLNLLATFSKFSFVRILLYVLSTPIELIYLFCSTFIYISFFPFARCSSLPCAIFTSYKIEQNEESPRHEHSFNKNHVPICHTQERFLSS